MKKFYKLVATAALFAGLVFTGCNNSLTPEDNYYSSSTTDTSTASVKTINITATSEEKMISFSSDSTGKSARTILPTAVDSDGLDFFIGAKKKGGEYTFKSITFTPTSASEKFTGTVTETYDLASYEFKLYAVPAGIETAAAPSDSTLKGEAYFVGYAAADLRYNDTVKFYLSSNTLSAAGSFDIDITSDWNIPTGYKVTAAVYTQDTEQLIYPTDEPLTITPTSLPGQISQTSGGNNSFKLTGIAVGTYNLVIVIESPASAGGKKYTYSEKLIILPGRTSTASIEVPDIIEYAPSRPKDLIAGYKVPTYTDKSYYPVEFTWTDTSYCERGFQLEILKVDGTTYFEAPKTDADWDAIITALSMTTEQKAVSSKDWAESYDTNLLVLNKSNFSTYINAYNDGLGTLNMNADHVTVYMELGHRFLARICAENVVGKSSYAYLDLHQGGTFTGKAAGCTAREEMDDTTGASGAAKTKTQVTNTPTYTLTNGSDEFPADTQCINLYKITYNLVGGTFVDAEGSLTAAQMPALVSYHSQQTDISSTPAASSTDTTILSPNSRKASVTPAITAEAGTDNTYLDTTGTKQTTVKLQLKNGDYYWKKWVQNSISGADYPMTTNATLTTTNKDESNVYPGYTNLQLFAIYTESTEVIAPVSIEDVTAYELEKEDIIITLRGTSDADKTADYITKTGANATLDDAENSLVDAAASLLQLASSGTNLVSKIILTKETWDPTTKKGCYPYDSIHLTVTRNGDNVVLQDEDFDTTNSNWVINVGNYQTGKYVIAITATTRSAPNVTYRIATVFEIVQ